MRFVKRLILQGYKTFASQTEFLFDSGVTAIVGPNGSGKSNIADSLRWVLGEQSYGTLRGKRTEDMIFSGSDERARLGMASVSLTLDNASGWLPIDFAEVEVARRAYRSGENEYYLNGNRVRLRDVFDLLSTSGLGERTYTVIGQGLVDQALSQRPEERRKLFEEAAGITAHQGKREQAAQRLVETQANLTRARDIVSELTPRLRYLKGQARRAQEHQQIKQDLEAQLRVWYGYKWRQAVAEQAATAHRWAESAKATAEEADAARALADEVIALRAERTALREQLGAWHHAGSELHRRSEAVQRELAVRSEQVRLWGENRADLERDLGVLRVTLEDGAERLRGAQAYLAEAEATHTMRMTQLAATERDFEARENNRQAVALRLAARQEAVLAAKAQLAERQAQLAQAGVRRDQLLQAEVEERRASQAALAELTKLDGEFERHLRAELAAADVELERLEQARRGQAQAHTAARAAEREAADELATAQRALARLQDRQEMLSRLQDEGAGMAAGPRAVLAARRRLPGVVGSLGDLIEAPAELERAIEAALGSRLQDIVVRRWEDAEAAVTFLKENRAGRATFLPLDSLRPGQAADVPRMPGVRGRASDLVRFDPAIRPAVELALNRILVVQDLATARALTLSPPVAASRTPEPRPSLRQEVRGAGSPTLVTLDGEIVRPTGSVTGGADGERRDSGLLARSRALRELPGQLRGASEQAGEWEGRVAEARSRQESARQAMEELGAQRDAQVASREKLRAEHNRLQLAAERLRQTSAWHEERGQATVRERAELDSREGSLAGEVARLTGEVGQDEVALQETRREVAELAADDLAGDAKLARLRAEGTVGAGQLRDYRSRVEELAAAQRRRTEELVAKEQRIGRLCTQLSEAGQAIGQQGESGQALAREIGDLAARIEPAEARLAQVERRARDAETQAEALQDSLRHAQMRQSQAELALRRVEDELSHLRSEMEKELGLVVLTHSVPPTGAGEEPRPPVGQSLSAGTRQSPLGNGWAEDGEDLLDSQPPLPMDDMVTRLPVVPALPEGLDTDVRNLRAQLARLGPVNLDALAEYHEVEARYNFLTTQGADLEAAIASLQEVIAELDRVMEREFLATFKKVSEQFREEFKNLFGGGTGRLVLTDPESPGTTGVEIIARPPGKREQGLALLSGGERALTAAALIFSILRSRPTPFCVLDEVDATLDEANVGRFREALRALSDQTQFILITHNRGTIEVADTIYGVSMGADNTSQVLSLKLNGREVVPAGPAEPD